MSEIDPGRPAQYVGARVLRVEDRVGFTVQEHFENFIEQFVEDPTSSAAPPIKAPARARAAS